MISMRTRFLAAPLVGTALVVSLAACGSSGGGSTGGSGATGGGGSTGGNGNSDASFCAYLQSHASALQNVTGDQKGAEGVLQNIVSQAPSDIKPAFQTLLDIVTNPTTANATKAQQAATQIASWGEKNCGASIGN